MKILTFLKIEEKSTLSIAIWNRKSAIIWDTSLLYGSDICCSIEAQLLGSSAQFVMITQMMSRQRSGWLMHTQQPLYAVRSRFCLTICLDDDDKRWCVSAACMWNDMQDTATASITDQNFLLAQFCCWDAHRLIPLCFAQNRERITHQRFHTYMLCTAQYMCMVNWTLIHPLRALTGMSDETSVRTHSPLTHSKLYPDFIFGIVRPHAPYASTHIHGRSPSIALSESVSLE